MCEYTLIVLLGNRILLIYLIYQSVIFLHYSDISGYTCRIYNYNSLVTCLQKYILITNPPPVSPIYLSLTSFITNLEKVAMLFYLSIRIYMVSLG